MTNQNDFVIDNGTGLAVRQDIQDALQALAGLSSGNSEPSVKYAYQLWADTNTGILKIRNGSNNAWVELLQLDGTLTMEDGSSSTPALAFRDDLNTGIFSSAADTFNVATGGVERMELGATTIFNEDGADVDFRIEGDTEANLFYLDAGNNRVGIGTSSPSRRFHVLTSANDEIATFINSDTTNGYGVNITAGGSASNRYILRLAEAGGSEKLRVSPAGKVGIGSSSLTYNLEVQGTGAQTILVGSTNAASATLILDGDSNGDGAGSDYASITHNSAGNIEINNRKSAAIIFKNTSSEEERMRVDEFGFVGVGHDSPAGFSSAARNLVVSTSSGNCGLTINTGAADQIGSIFFAEGTSASGQGRIRYEHANNALAFSSDGNEAMRIDSSQRLLLGATSAFDTAAGNGKVQIDGGTTAALTVTGNSNASQTRISFFNLNGRVGFISTDGSATVYNTSGSDKTLKKNFESWTENTLDLFKNINPQKFNFIHEDDGAKKSKGFIAQEMISSFPEAYTKEDKKDAKYYFNPSGMVVYLMKAIQELEAKVAALEAA